VLPLDRVGGRATTTRLTIRVCNQWRAELARTRRTAHRARSVGRCGHRLPLLPRQVAGEMPMATRRDLSDPADPATLRPEQRLSEVAAILAAGLIRMRTELAAALPRCLCRPPRSAAKPTSADAPTIRLTARVCKK
jgi:hypothetical protein